MRLQRIVLQWFRGAAQSVTLPINSKSLVIYGPNGAGKSSFVDAVEYLLCNGRIGHLSHEYSGKKQEKGVLNTHKPTLESATATIEFFDGTSATATVDNAGAFVSSGTGLAHLTNLDYRRTVLRQDEVSAFISSQKGEKYSALLPLLGLEQLEAAAEGVRQLTRKVLKQSDLDARRNDHSRLAADANNMFITANDVEAKVAALHARYRASLPRKTNLAADCIALLATIRSKLEGFTPDVQRHSALRPLASLPLAEAIATATATEKGLAAASISLLRERLDVLKRTEVWLGATSGGSLSCPACGQAIAADTLAAHLEEERSSLSAEAHLLDLHNRASASLRDVLASAKQAILDPLVTEWWSALGPEAAADLIWVRAVDPAEALQPNGAALRNAVAARLLPIISAAKRDSAVAPPQTRELLEDSEAARAGEAFMGIAAVATAISSISQALDHLGEVESALRRLIRERADTVIADISKDVQRMWAILHPGNDIEDIRLRHPDDTDKAIDIELKFFGVEQKSPRLTLSEGNRNSLGLCVFLAMALRADVDDPVILDDVVVSLDRDHRGMIVELLEKDFAQRQVIILTHDREWFAELKQLLNNGWQHIVLRPYLGPTDGISWSVKVSTFDDARGQVATAPDAAGNTARKILDTELGLITEKLKVKMEYKQGLRNDHRMAHEVLQALASASGAALQRRQPDGSYKASDDLKILLDETDKLVIAWGNRSSHTFDITKAEATKLIDKCEAAIDAFKCSDCGKAFYKFDDASGVKQCECSAIRWRYGKL